jgi:hypothetical protein
MNHQEKLALFSSTVTEGQRPKAGMALAIVVLVSLWGACDESSCMEGFRNLEPGVRCSQFPETCYKKSDGTYCRLERSYSIEECKAHGGEAMSDLGDGSLIRKGCPGGRQTLAYIAGEFIEGGLCCW